LAEEYFFNLLDSKESLFVIVHARGERRTLPEVKSHDVTGVGEDKNIPKISCHSLYGHRYPGLHFLIKIVNSLLEQLMVEFRAVQQRIHDLNQEMEARISVAIEAVAADLRNVFVLTNTGDIMTFDFWESSPLPPGMDDDE
jgi:hypothetical protein